MENPCKIIFFGDSITRKYTPIFEKVLRQEYPEIELTIVNAGAIGETSRDGLKRVDRLITQSPQVVVISFGMNDWRKDVPKEEFKKDLSYMINKFEEINARVLLTTINPDYQGFLKGTSKEVDEYSCIIRKLAREKRVKIADVNSLWKRKIKPIQRGLQDQIHPNGVGYRIICESLMCVVPRRITTVLWQYNGHEAKCNYRCPYCYYIGLHSPCDRFFGTIDQWHEWFKHSFGNQHVVFYLGFGEPMLGSNFYEVVNMIESEANWELRIISNISQPLEKLVKAKLAKEGRLHINASFHPLAVSIDEFLKKLLFLREHGIEAPVVYVMYPPFLKRFESDIAVFSKHNFLVHLRRFQGTYRDKEYPSAYTDEERQLIAKYFDDVNLKYMLNQKDIYKYGMSYTGMHFFIVDNVGNIGYDSNSFTPYTKGRCVFGNIFQDNFKPLLEPGIYPADRVGTVDGVTNLLELNYKELEGNHVLSFARQGGVYHTESRVFYKHKNTDFNNSRIRAEYYFPSRNIKDEFCKLVYLGAKNYIKYRISQKIDYLKTRLGKYRFIRLLYKKLS